MDPETMSDTMDKQYGAQTRTNMRARKRKIDLPLKLRIQPTINSKRSKVLHANVMVQNIGNNRHDNVMRNLLVTTILTQYHVSKGLKVFGDLGVAAILKELKQLHARMLMEPKTPTK